MIYAKTKVVDGLYTVKCFNEFGVDITTTLEITNELYVLDSNGVYTLVEIVEGSSKQLLADYLDQKTLYVTLKINTAVHKTFLKTPVVTTSTVKQYTVLYKTHTALPRQSNILLERFTYFLPKWSSAYKNDVSNYSKITYPYFCNIEKLYFKTSELVDLALAGLPFYRKVVSSYNKDTVGKIINSDGTELRYTYDKSSAQISKLSLKDLHYKDLDKDIFRLTADVLDLPRTIKSYCSTLYIRAPLHSNVIVRGLDKNGSFVTETFRFSTLNTKTSKFKYKTLTDVFCSSPSETTISNYLDCCTDHLTESFQDIPAFSNKAKKVQFPRIYVDEDVLNVAMISDSSLEYEHAMYTLSKSVSHLHLNKYGDIVALASDGHLYTGLLNKNIEVDMPILSNNNVNKYVFMDEVDTDTKRVYFSVDCQRLYQDIEELNIMVEIQSDEGIFYLDGITREIVDKPTTIVISKHNSLKLCFDYRDTNYLSVTVKTLSESFQASFRNDKIQLIKHGDLSFQTLQLVNNKLVAQDSSSNYNEISIEKNYYEINDEGYVTLYEPNSKVYTLKGKLINV